MVELQHHSKNKERAVCPPRKFAIAVFPLPEGPMMMIFKPEGAVESMLMVVRPAVTTFDVEPHGQNGSN
jgi:hypothetical protein